MTQRSVYPTSSIEITEEQFEQLRNDSDNPLLRYLDFVDVGNTAYRARRDDFRGNTYFEEVEDGV